MIARIFTAAAASALLAGAAQAQTTPAPQPMTPADGSSGMAGAPQTMPMDSGAMSAPAPGTSSPQGSMPADGMMAPPSSMPADGTMAPQGAMTDPAMSGSAMAPSADMAGANASTGMGAMAASTVTMQPIPDTAETRQQYRPLSGAGRRSAASGN